MTVSREKIRRPSGAWLIPSRTSLWAGVCETSRPRKWTVPARGWSRPLIVLRVVVLPAPFEPIRVTISPSRTSRGMPWRAGGGGWGFVGWGGGPRRAWGPPPPAAPLPEVEDGWVVVVTP